MVTQVKIAEVLGLDVSSMNKILNRTPGPVFNPKTIKRVFAMARRMGYNFRRETKPLLKNQIEELKRILRDLVPENSDVEYLSKKFNLNHERILEIVGLVYGKKSA